MTAGMSYALGPAAAQQTKTATASRPPDRRSGPVPRGNQALLRRLQAKLAVGPMDDPLEREADVVTEQVMTMPAPVTATNGVQAAFRSVDGAVAQRQADPSADQADPAADEESLPGGAPAVFDDDIDPEDAEGASSQSTDASAAEPAIQRSVDSGIVRRQGAPTPSPSGPAPLVAQTLRWLDYPVVPNRSNGLSAVTHIRRIHRHAGAFSAQFAAKGSWSVAADQTPGLLRHEQYHLNLAVLIANKANAIQAAGTMGTAALVSAFMADGLTHDNSYDQDTNHGRNARMQTLWENDIDAGVPEFPITP
jgi:hypothetical protein